MKTSIIFECDCGCQIIFTKEDIYKYYTCPQCDNQYILSFHLDIEVNK